MKSILFLILSLLLVSCTTTKIKVLDYKPHEPLSDVLVLTTKSHYPFGKSTIETKKTNRMGEVNIDYNPSDVVAAKIGYWHARESEKNLIYLLRCDMNPMLIPYYGGLSVVVKNEMSKNDVYYKDWIRYIDYEKKLQIEHIGKNYKDVKDGVLPFDKDIEAKFMRIQSEQRGQFIQSHKKD